MIKPFNGGESVSDDQGENIWTVKDCWYDNMKGWVISLKEWKHHQKYNNFAAANFRLITKLEKALQ